MKLQAQCPTASFTLADTVCVNQTLAITNASSGATSYGWDFCSGDLSQTPVVTNLITLTGGNAPVGITVVQDGSNWYGFVTGRGSNELYRIDLGSSPTNATPTFVNLGNPGGLFNTADKIRLIKEGGKWYGLVTNDFANSLIRLSFGTSLTNTPTAVDLGNLGILNRPRGLEIVQDQGKVIVVITNTGDNSIQLINFGSSIANTPTQTLSSAAVAGASGIVGISIVRECNRWVGVVVSTGNNRLFKLDFGSSLFSSPITVDITNGYGYSAPFDIQLVQDKEEYIGLLCSESGQLYKLNFGSSISANMPKVSNLGSFGGSIYNTATLAVVKEGSQWSFWTINYSNNQLSRGVFPNACAVSQAISSAVSPTTVSYSKPGKYYIDLTAYDANGNARTTTDSVIVVGVFSLNFTTNKQCLGNKTQFLGSTPQPTDIVSWTWNFGEPANAGENVNLQNPFHQFSTSGTYQVSLTITDKRGCSNSITKTVEINNKKPIPLFDYVPVYCPDNAIQFSDLSTPFSGETITRWQWTFGDTDNPGAGSTLQNPKYIYSRLGNYLVSLTVFGKSGCDATIEKMISVSKGTASFTLADTVCVNQTLAITNASSGATSYGWDFCSGDLSQTPVVTNLITLTGGNAPVGITVVQDGSNWYGFVTGRGSNELYRIDLGSSPTNATPTFVNLGNPGGLFNTADKIRLIKEGGKWYGLVTNDFANSLIRLSFGTSLTNTPTAVDLGNLGILNRPRGLEIVQDQGKVIVVITNTGDNSIQLINFGSSIANTPTQTLSSAAVAGASGIVGISIVRECNRWVGVVVSTGNNRLFKLDFGSSLFSSPITVDITNGYGYSAPFDIQLVQDKEEYIGLLCSESGQLYKLNFGSSISANMPKVSNLGSFGGSIYNTATLAVVKEGSQWSFWTINYSNNQLSRGVFPNACAVSQAISSAVSPTTVSYSKPGKYYIDLTAYDANGNARTTTDSVIVKNSVAPAISFTTDDQCTQLVTKFFGPQQEVANWQWNFGDTNMPSGDIANTSIEQNPRHQYSRKGIYQVTLVVTSDNGCSNRITQFVTIYDNPKPTPAFSFPNGQCSYIGIPFTDQSVATTGDKVRNWRWDFGDGETSTLQNSIHTFSQGGDYQVTLSVSGLSGCDTTITQKVSILPGANVDFDYSKTCIGDTLTFTNLTAPEGNWLWDFGDPSSPTNTSTEKNPRHFYNSIGKYTVKLWVTTANGCVVSRQKEVKVRALPIVDFIYSKVCAKSPITFTISTANSDTTVAGITWDFGDPGSSENSSTEESPVHTFVKEGIYTVRLTIVTAAGCQSFITHQVEVNALSIPDFNFSTACANRSVAFSDMSVSATNDAIGSWSWDFGDNSPIVIVKSPVHTYLSPGVYTVKLTIQGSQSSCQNTVSKQLQVYAQPQVNFTTTPSCADYSVYFTDNSNIINGQIQNWEWNFGGQGTSQEQNPIFNFNRTGTFVVTLKITSKNGCTASLSRSVTVDVLPEADFSFSPDFQAPPIEVKFSNNSNRATNYQWDFGDGSPVSTEINPRHIYQAIGTYSVKLIAFRNTDCSDTLIKAVNVTVLVLNAKVSNVAVSTLNGLYTVVAEVINNGTVPITTLDFILRAGTALSIQEKWTGVLNPNQSIIYAFKAQVVKNSFQELPYFCVEAENPNGQSDVVPTDDRFCAALLDEFAVLPVYPNPGNTQVVLTCILPEIASVEAYLVDTHGKRVASFLFENTKIGYNEFRIDISSVNQGLYLLQTVYQGQIQGQRLMKKK